MSGRMVAVWPWTPGFTGLRGWREESPNSEEQCAG